MLLVVTAVAVEPAVGRALHARRAALHVVLRVEVAARGIGGADGVNRGETLVVPQALEGREAWVQAEMPVEIHNVVRRNGDAGPLPVVERVAVRHDHVQAVYRDPLYYRERRSEEHTSELQSLRHLVCRLLL